MASNAEKVSIWWRHHVKLVFQNFALPSCVPGLHLYGFVIEYCRLTKWFAFRFDISIGLYSTQFFMLLDGDSIRSLQCVLFINQMGTFSALLALCVCVCVWGGGGGGGGGSSVDSPHKGQWHRALMFSLFCSWTNGWANNRDAGDLRCHRAHYDAIVMSLLSNLNYDHFLRWVISRVKIHAQHWSQISSFRVDHQRYWALLLVPMLVVGSYSIALISEEYTTEFSSVQL